jgi:putative transposase
MTESLEEILMKKSRHSPEEIVTILRAAETNEQPLAEFCRAHSISQETFYRWRRRFSGLEVPAAKQLRDLSGENTRLKQLLAERDLEVAALKSLVQKKW